MEGNNAPLGECRNGATYALRFHPERSLIRMEAVIAILIFSHDWPECVTNYHRICADQLKMKRNTTIRRDFTSLHNRLVLLCVVCLTMRLAVCRSCGWCRFSPHFT